MSKSIYEIIESGSIEIKHGNETCNFQLPSWLREASGLLEDEEGLLKWATENEITHSLLHAGLQTVMIKLRAAGRPADRQGQQISMVENKEDCQEAIFDFIIKPIARPNTGGAANKFSKNQIRLKMKALGMTDEQIEAVIGGL